MENRVQGNSAYTYVPYTAIDAIDAVDQSGDKDIYEDEDRIKNLTPVEQ